MQPTEAYDITNDLLGRHEAPWTERTADEEAAESFMVEVCFNLYTMI